MGNVMRYHSVPWSAVDQDIATFSNSRRCKILFTRVDDNDYYLYGRLLVHCARKENGNGRHEVYVSAEDSECLPLGAFVDLHEDAEHAHFEHVFSSQGCQGPLAAEHTITI